MSNIKNGMRAAIAGFILASATFSPAFADDTEIYLSTAPSAAVRPNVLLIVDNSLSMDANDVTGERAEYNRNTTYGTSGNCTAGRIFFKVKGAAQPDCTSTNYIVAASNSCQKLANATNTGATGGLSGRWTGKAARFDTATAVWTDLEPLGTASAIDCLADSGTHGSNAASTPNVYARNGLAGTPYTSLAGGAIDWSTRTTYTFYSANWLNWYRTTPATSTVRRIQGVENAVVNMVSSVDDINMGMMRFNLRLEAGTTDDHDYAGGLVTNIIENIDTNRSSLISTITNNGAGNASGAAGFAPNTATMLSETLWEAHQYWSGGQVYNGGRSDRDSRIPSSGNYTTPITSTCQKNFQIILTDGRPTWDNQADTRIELKTGTPCTGTPGDSSISGDVNDGRCLDELAGYMHNPTTDLVSDTLVAGGQQVTTYTIGFGASVAGATFLTEVANDGGGQRYDAANSTQLQSVFDEITSDILDVATTFSTASVSVNAFNRTASREDLYFALFAPEDRARWDGNLKKYKLAVHDPDGAAGSLPPDFVVTGQGTVADAIDPATGFFRSGVRSYWSTTTDGNVVTDGGAANNLPLYSARNIYTHIETTPATTTLTLVTDTAVTATMLGAADATQRTAVLDFMRARAEKRMGDPMHSVPQVVTYGGTVTSPIDVVYTATNDGVLHAINAADSSGVEMWGFVPQELLARQKALMDNASTTTRGYGLDGDVRILRYDVNQDGVITSGDGDRVWLYVGMRRGGRHYYALDVTDRNSPRLLFKLGPTQLPNVGETWSPPTITRVDIAGAAQNNQRLVLIFGGGYDSGQESAPMSTDDEGNRIYMVDAKTGALLWYAGMPTATLPLPNLSLNSMTNSIPSRITVMDLNGDAFADRMYAADLGGRVFRFDITHGNGASTLVTGGVIAALGQGAAAGGMVATPNILDTRRFYSGPDAALIQSRGATPYISLSLGSGYRGHPLNTQTVDRFYSLRDKAPNRKYTNAQYTDGTVPVILDNTPGLYDITLNPAGATIPASAVGWKYSFSARLGEKVLSEATTGGGVVLFTTYQPTAPDPSEPCRSRHVNRAYAINVGSGRPALDFNNNNTITNADLFEQVTHDGILGGVNIAVIRGDLMDQYLAACAANAGGCPGVPGSSSSSSGSSSSGSGGGGGGDGNCGNGAVAKCVTGMHILGRCINVCDGGRTYWRKRADSGN